MSQHNTNQLYQSDRKRPLIILTGPTAVGKTDLSIALAKQLGCEIISADSIQVYRHMNIGSAKIAPQEMQGIPHHLVDQFEPDFEFNIYKFQQYAKRYVKEIYAKGKIPLIVGGTGFYIQALLYDIAFNEQEDEETQGAHNAYRKQLEAIAKEQGADALHQMLKQVDETSAAQIHPNNIKRVVRAIEYYKQTGEPISKHNHTERQKESPYHFIYFVLNDHRELLYERINMRVDKMIEQGLVEEVASLKKMGYDMNCVSMQGIGYKEIYAYLNGECSLDEAIYILKRDTRHFAKRQLTWFRRERDVTWINRYDYESETEMLNAMLRKIQDKNILQ